MLNIASDSACKVDPLVKPKFNLLNCVKGGQRYLLQVQGDFCATAAKALKERDIDMIDCSSGGITGDSNMPPLPRVVGYQVGFAERIRHEAGIATIAVGNINDADLAESILRNGRADLVAIARELLWNPNLPSQMALDLNVPDGYGVMTEEYAHRLRRREEVKNMSINAGGAETQAAMRVLMGEDS